MGSSNKNTSNRDLFNLNQNGMGNNNQKTNTTNNIFDTLGDVFAKNTSPNSIDIY